MQLADNLAISDQCRWVRRVPHTDVAKYLNQMDVYVALSRLDSESFGVAIIEASACGIPVIVSDVGGLPEVVKDGETGIIVEKENPQEAGDSLVRLVRDKEFLNYLGEKGARHLKTNYDWRSCVMNMKGFLSYSIETGPRLKVIPWSRRKQKWGQSTLFESMMTRN